MKNIRRILFIIALAVNVLFVGGMVIFAVTSYRPRNTAEFFYLVFCLSIPLVNMYAIVSKRARERSHLSTLTSSGDTSPANIIKGIAILLNAALIFLIVVVWKNQSLYGVALILFITPSLLVLCALCLDQNWQWIGFHTGRKTLEERRTHPYNKLALVALFFSTLPIFGVALLDLPLSRIISASSSLLGITALFQIKQTKERGAMLAAMAVMMTEILKVVEYLLTIDG